jgi:hypothetical protein
LIFSRFPNTHIKVRIWEGEVVADSSLLNLNVPAEAGNIEAQSANMPVEAAGKVLLEEFSGNTAKTRSL